MTKYYIAANQEREYQKTSRSADQFHTWKLATTCGDCVLQDIFRSTATRAFAFVRYAREIRGIESATLYVQIEGDWHEWICL